MAGYLGTKAVFLSTTASSVTGNASVTGDFTVDTNTLHVDSTNNRVGVGTSSPAVPLDVNGRIRTDGGTNFLDIYHNGSIGYLETTGGAATPIGFANNGAERMRIDASGSVLVGTTSDLGKLTVYDTRTTNGSAAFMVQCAGGSSQGFFVRSDGYCSMPWTYSNATSGASANMVIGNGGFIYRSTSSLKYKDNIQDTPHGLAEVMALRPVTYTGKSEQDGDTVFGGLIAEEVHAAGLTEFVSYDENGEPDALHYGQMVSLAFKAIQEQNAALQEALTEIADLKARVTALEAN